MNWEINKRWSDKFIPVIKPILGYHFISEPPIEEDMNHNTDLMVLRMDAIRFGCRIRRYSYYQNDKYRNQFTIRSSLPSGGKTELTKLIEGWGDYLFYGFSNENETDLISWFIGDLKVFRTWFNKCLWNNIHSWETKKNIDNSSDFMVFNLKEMPEEFIFKSKCKQEKLERHTANLFTV